MTPIVLLTISVLTMVGAGLYLWRPADQVRQLRAGNSTLAAENAELKDALREVLEVAHANQVVDPAGADRVIAAVEPVRRQLDG